jgi:DNA-binding XRE family transcriptional regulator
MKTLHSPSADEYRQKRKESSLSQNGMAELLGLHKNTIKNIEAGRTKCSPQLWYFTLARIAERNKEIVAGIEEHCRRWNSQVYRNEWKRKAKAKYGD